VVRHCCGARRRTRCIVLQTQEFQKNDGFVQEKSSSSASEREKDENHYLVITPPPRTDNGGTGVQIPD